eukprot:TRINITY_DN868_c0_g1_i4.p1 TRINITY_DN868_c0_g1~~TRINITY_DN868_c0_g1_i4.p1  ORF type:complete len:495 (-),score=81.88 TRINITY_DN868_c0_g1_i4:37-1482(-)
MVGEEKDFNVFVSSENGIVKGVSVNKKCNISKNFDKLTSLTKTSGYTCLGVIDKDQHEILVANRVPEVKEFSIKDKCFKTPFAVEENEAKSSLVGVTKYNGSYVTVAQNGRVDIWKKDERVTFNAIDVEANSHGKLAKKDQEWKNEEEKEKHAESLKIGRKLCRMRRSLDPETSDLIALGGQEVDLQVWNLAKPQEPVFRAKNVRSDSLEMRVPVWISDIAFLDQSNVAICSKYGHIRKYDISGSQRRPVRDLVWEEKGENMVCTAMCTINENQVIVGTSTGKLGLWDFRKNEGYRGLIRKYKGCVGAVRDISFSNGYFGVVGLDRFLRIYTIKDDKPKFNVYLKSKLSGVTLLPGFQPDQEPETEKDEGVIIEDGNEDDIEVLEEGDEEVSLKDKIANTRLEQLLSLPSSTYKDKDHPFHEFFQQTRKQRKLLKTTDSDVERDKALEKMRETFAAFKDAHLMLAEAAADGEKPAKKRKVV